MIERLLAAEGALARDELDHAERLYGQVADADPRNAIALVGLARVASRRGDMEGARDHAERALAIDPDEAAARRLLVELSAPPEPHVAVSPATEPVASAVAPARAQARRASLLQRLFGWLGLRR